MPTELQTIESKAGVWITAHHGILYLLLAVAIFFGVYQFEASRADIARTEADAAKTALAVEKDHSKQLSDVYAANEIERQKSIAQAQAAIADAKTKTQVQIVHDKALPAPELGHRIESITGFKQGTITLDPQDDLILPIALARDIVVRLDVAAQLETTVSQQQVIITQQAGKITDQANIIAEDKVVLAEQIKTDGKVLSKAKWDGRKGKLKWFGIGYVAGFGSAIALKIWHP